MQIDWRNLPEGHTLSWHWKDEEERLEQQLSEAVNDLVKKAETQGIKVEGIRVHPTAHDVELHAERLFSVNLKGEVEQVRGINSELKQERIWREHQRKILLEAGKRAEPRLLERGINPNEYIEREAVFYTFGIAVHPILKTLFRGVPDLEKVADLRVLKGYPLHEAFGLSKEDFEKIYWGLYGPISNYIAYGLNEEALVDAMSLYGGKKDEARETIRKIDRRLGGSTKTFLEARKDLIELIRTHTDPNPLLELIDGVVAGYSKVESLREKFGEFLPTSQVETTLQKIREKQEVIGELQRAKVIQAMGSPDEKMKWVFSTYYKSLWPYSLALSWADEGKPYLLNIDAVHSKIGRIAADIVSAYYTGKSVINKTLLDTIEKLGIGLDNPRYWSKIGAGLIIKNPKFPITEEMQGGFLGSVFEGKTTYSNGQFTFSYGERRTLGERSFERFKVFGGFEPAKTERKEPGESLKKFGQEKFKDSYTRFALCLPSQLSFVLDFNGIEKVDEENAWKLARMGENLLRGYIEQAIWDRGRVTEATINYWPNFPEQFMHMLKRLEINYTSHSIAYMKGTAIHIPSKEVDAIPFLSEFRASYSGSKV